MPYAGNPLPGSPAIMRMLSFAGQNSVWISFQEPDGQPQAADREPMIRALLIRCLPAMFTQQSLSLQNTTGWIAAESQEQPPGATPESFSGLCIEWNHLPAVPAGGRQKSGFQEQKLNIRSKGTGMRSAGRILVCLIRCRPAKD